MRSVITSRRLLQVAVGTVTLALGAWALSALIPVDRGSDRVQIASLTPNARVAHQTPAPQVWLSALVITDTAPFAAPGYAPEPVFPRATRVVPPLPPRSPSPDVVATAPVTPVTPVAPPPADRTTETTPPPVDRPVAVAALTLPPAGPELATPERTDQRAEVDDPATLRAPRRSLIPQARPQAVVLAAAAARAAAESAVAAVETASPDADRPVGAAMALALASSRTPQPRPAAVTRLASLSLDAAPAPTVLAPQREPLSVPPLSRAIARSDQCGSALTRSIPRRSRSAGDGSAVIGQLASASGSARDGAIISEVMGGNIPDFLRNLVPVTFTGEGPGGQQTRITLCVMPDYLAVGSDRDFVRVPLGLPAAMRVAERFDMVLPTTRMVDVIYAQASVRLSPAPMEPGAQMESTNYFLRHNTTVERQRHEADGRLGLLVSGHKKDLVLTNRLETNPGRVAIYGWHRRSGAPIQPLSTIHGAQYADYSHGVRLISRRAFVNGQAVDLRDLLSDSRLAGLVSAEGIISNRQLLAALQ